MRKRLILKLLLSCWVGGALSLLVRALLGLNAFEKLFLSADNYSHDNDTLSCYSKTARDPFFELLCHLGYYYNLISLLIATDTLDFINSAVLED